MICVWALTEESGFCSFPVQLAVSFDGLDQAIRGHYGLLLSEFKVYIARRRKTSIKEMTIYESLWIDNRENSLLCAPVPSNRLSKHTTYDHQISEAIMKYPAKSHPSVFPNRNYLIYWLGRGGRADLTPSFDTCLHQILFMLWYTQAFYR